MNDMVEDIDYMRASASMPFVSHTVEKGGMKLLDGGCSDSVPYRAFRKMGYEKNVVVLTRPADYRKKPSKNKLAGIVYKKYPKFVEKLGKRPEEYNQMAEEIQKLEKEGNLFVIRPETPLGIGRMSHDVREIDEAYERGRADALASLDKMRKWLAEE